MQMLYRKRLTKKRLHMKRLTRHKPADKKLIEQKNSVLICENNSKVLLETVPTLQSFYYTEFTQ